MFGMTSSDTFFALVIFICIGLPAICKMVVRLFRGYPPNATSPAVQDSPEGEE
jgi:hypothetical protein